MSLSTTQLKNLTVKQLPDLCEEIRQTLISEVTETGGHLASNLGAVELSVALHFVFGERDKIVWDVGHQCYTHKLLTGRSLTSLRQSGGTSGFPDFVEDASDNFTVGHAGTAISQALGLAKARDIKGEDYSVVAVVGDGSLTNGLSYEALNNVKDTKLLIVVNDNNMSISQSVGTSTLNLSKLRVGKYDKNKQRLKNTLNKIPLVGKPLYRFLRWCKRRAKLGYYRNSYFDNFDIKYIGIIDGNEVADLVYYLTKIRDNVTKPTVLHIITKKGKGYAPAEENPTAYHSVAPKNAQKGLVEASTIVSDTLVAMAEKDDKICAVCAAMSGAVGFDKFAERYPDRFFDVGIAEEHAVTFAGGLARGGMRPFVGIYNTFLQRSYDEILHDVALQNLPVTFLTDRSGLVGEDGKTHQGTFGFGYLGNIPNLKIWCPFTRTQLKRAMERSLEENCPVAICYPRYLSDLNVSFGERWAVLKTGKSNVTVLAVGARMVEEALKLKSDVTVVAVTSVKPLDKTTLDGLQGTVITLEENVLDGGFGQRIAAYFSANKSVSVLSCGVPDCFVEHATVAEQLDKCGLSAERIDEFISQKVKIVNV